MGTNSIKEYLFKLIVIIILFPTSGNSQTLVGLNLGKELISGFILNEAETRQLQVFFYVSQDIKELFALSDTSVGRLYVSYISDLEILKEKMLIAKKEETGYVLYDKIRLKSLTKDELVFSVHDYLVYGISRKYPHKIFSFDNGEYFIIIKNWGSEFPEIVKTSAVNTKEWSVVSQNVTFVKPTDLNHWLSGEK